MNEMCQIGVLLRILSQFCLSPPRLMGALLDLGRVLVASTIKTRRYKACSKYANYTSFNKNDFPKVKLTLIMQVALPYRQQI